MMSRPRILGGVGLLLFIHLLLGFLNYIFVSGVVMDDQFMVGMTVAFLVIQFLLLLLFMNECKLIFIREDKIDFRNPILPFLKKTYDWTDFDYFITADESRKHGSNDAVWLVKDEKLIVRFSSAYYSNYDKLKANLKLENRGNIHADFFSQVGVRYLGQKIETTTHNNR